MIALPFFVIIPLGLGFTLPLLEKWADKKKMVEWLAFLGSLTLFGLALAMAGKVGIYQLSSWKPPLGINYVLDGLSGLMLLVVSFISTLSIMYATKYLEGYRDRGKFYGLFMLMLAGMFGVVLSGDIFNLFVYLEVAAISSYALVGFNRGAEELEASFKYLIMGAVGSVFILFGVGLTYGYTGSLNMADIYQILATKSGGSVVMLMAGFFFLGFGLKAALVPFHAWLPDAHSSAPTPISAMLSGVLIKVLGVYALTRITFNVLGAPQGVTDLFMWGGVLSMLVGALLAIGQEDFKRILAYSSVSQIGYILVGIGVGGGLIIKGELAIAGLAFFGGLFHLLNHAIYKSLLFFSSGSIEYRLGTRDLGQMGGINKVMPITGSVGTIGTLSISGIPPFSGFWSKLAIILACLLGGYYMVAGFTLLASVLTLAYYLRVQREIFFGPLADLKKKVKEVPALMYVPMVFLAILCVVLGILYLPTVRGVLFDPAVDVLKEGNKYLSLVLGS